jgi:hypothetical protein
MVIANAGAIVMKYESDAISFVMSLAIAAHVTSTEEELAKLLATQCTVTWLATQFQTDLAFPTVIAIIYLAHPFMTRYPMMAKVTKYAVFAVSNDPHVKSLPYWITTILLLIVRRINYDDVLTSFATYAGTHVLILSFIEVVRPMVEHDPLLVLTSLLIGIRVAMEILDKNTKK